jgi:putative SOS response-associated peptidase YedK
LQHHPFAILTTAANRLVAQRHDRMPVILSPEEEGIWLNPEASPVHALACLQPLPAPLRRITLGSPKVNVPTSKAPDLLQRVTDDRPGGVLHQ